MDDLDLLRSFGCFDARVPRYTSYPPANRFVQGFGQRFQRSWLGAVVPDQPLSLYVHIPFCRRLCWFCACRTQGTTTLNPVEAYLGSVIAEIESVAHALPARMQMARLHLGGGTPTLLSPDQMQRLLRAIRKAFDPSAEFEFSVEVDPTECTAELIAILGEWGLSRASIGIQDFNPEVQEAIGRLQSVEETERAAALLRAVGAKSLNVDLLYGLPHQTEESLDATMRDVLRLSPERIALFGYAHVPHMSKRQVMIDEALLPGLESRYLMARHAAARLCSAGYEPLGIDHFAKPEDGLCQAADTGRLKRNFQGYTDDPCGTLLGFGASAISKFRDGYVQNAVATAAYHARIEESGLAGHRGYRLAPAERVLGRMIEMLMCDLRIDLTALEAEFPGAARPARLRLEQVAPRFGGAARLSDDWFQILPGMEQVTRIICAALDPAEIEQGAHSAAI